MAVSTSVCAAFHEKGGVGTIPYEGAVGSSSHLPLPPLSAETVQETRFSLSRLFPGTSVIEVVAVYTRQYNTLSLSLSSFVITKDNNNDDPATYLIHVQQHP